MPQPLAGAGQGLQLPQNLYPANLTNGEVTSATNTFSLAPGEAMPLPAGRFEVFLGKYCSLQYQDPVTTAWTLIRDNENNDGSVNIWSDGFNVRVANLTGCVVGAVVTNAGSGYTQSTTTVTPSTGNSTWQPIVGGAIGTTVSVTTAGSGYGIAPLVFIDAPPSPGVQATAVAVLSSGSVSSVTVTNQGAGYTTAPNVTFVTNPADPNIGTAITSAAATATLTGTGSITAVICTNSGASVATTMSLTIAGGGASAAATPVFMQTVTATSITTGGGGYTTSTYVSTTGGYNTVTPTWTNPTFELTGFVPRPANIRTTITGSAISTLTIIDGGLFLSAPVALPATSGIVTTVATLVLTTGGANDTLRVQQVS